MPYERLAFGRNDSRSGEVLKATIKMNIEELKKDVAATHVVFDLCKVRKTNRCGAPLSLRMRALILAASAGCEVTQDMVEQRLREPN